MVGRKSATRHPLPSSVRKGVKFNSAAHAHHLTGTQKPGKCAKCHGVRPAAAGRRRIPCAKAVAAATALQGAFGTGIFIAVAWAWNLGSTITGMGAVLLHRCNCRPRKKGRSLMRWRDLYIRSNPADARVAQPL